MTHRIEKAEFFGEINAIPSKSFAHRIAIMEFWAGKEITAGGTQNFSKDIEATVNCLNALRNGETVLDCNESGSTLRFLIPIVATLGKSVVFKGKGRLLQRPNKELFSALEPYGVTFIQNETLTVKGKLSAGDYYISGKVSSQYVSGLLMALSNLSSSSRIILTSPLSSAPYVDITLSVMRSYGVNVDKTDYGFFVEGNAKYCGELSVEGDWSNSAFLLALGALSKEVTVFGLNKNSVQGDKEILNLLKNFGANVEISDSYVKVKKGEFKPFILDAEDCPDMVLISAVIASFAKGTSVIKNVSRLRLKESDRIQSVISLLDCFNIKASSDGFDLTVIGGNPTAIKPIDCFNDHRVVMSAAVLAGNSNGEAVLKGTEAVSKSYPEFFKDYLSLGGKAYEV